MNSFSIIRYLTRAAEEFETSEESFKFITEQKDSFANNPDTIEAYITLAVKGASLKLALNDREGCKADLDECKKLLESKECSELSTIAAFHYVYMLYYKELKDHLHQYQTTFQYLSAINIDELPLAQKQQIAYDLCISALLGEDLYNFGELLIHPILSCLEFSENNWLRQLIHCFNNGDIDLFNKLCNSQDFLNQPELVQNFKFLKQKLCLMTLVESIFRGTKEKLGRISFKEISEKTMVKIDEIEHLLMKALSIGLVKGKINQVEQFFSVQSVQPRVLDMDQIKHLSSRLNAWSEGLKKYIVVLEKKTESIEC